MEKSILSEFQKIVLTDFTKTLLCKKYYLAGGTALSEFYLHHRKSEDLDFFTEEELKLHEIENFVRLISSHVSSEKVEYQHGFGLYTYFFYPKKETVKHKIDFGQYPFPLINPPKRINNILVESLYDIAVDKSHTISIQPRLRDFIDLWFIFKMEKDWHFKDLVRRAFEKFGIKVDPLQLGENLYQVTKLKDIPIILKPFNRKEMEAYFIKEIKDIEKGIWK